MTRLYIIIGTGMLVTILWGLVWLSYERRQTIPQMLTDALYWLAATIHAIACAASSAIATYRAQNMNNRKGKDGYAKA